MKQDIERERKSRELIKANWRRGLLSHLPTSGAWCVEVFACQCRRGRNMLELHWVAPLFLTWAGRKIQDETPTSHERYPCSDIMSGCVISECPFVAFGR